MDILETLQYIGQSTTSSYRHNNVALSKWCKTGARAGTNRETRRTRVQHSGIAFGVSIATFIHGHEAAYPEKNF